MIQVQVLAPGQRAPRHQALAVVGEGRVGPSLVRAARPHRAVDQPPRLGLQILELQSGVLRVPSARSVSGSPTFSSISL